tara:strand:+ start:178 stop:636 length:459 start_codon:yes stop_codon:yes gene_type:complete
MSDTTLVDFEDFREADDMSFSDFTFTSGGGPGSGRRKGSRRNKKPKKTPTQSIRGGARNASSSNKDGKKNFELVVNGNVKHVFHNKYARGAALKAATRGYTTIRLRERGTDKVHLFKGSVSREPLAAGASFRAAKDGMVKVPKVKKIRIERL